MEAVVAVGSFCALGYAERTQGVLVGAGQGFQCLAESASREVQRGLVGFVRQFPCRGRRGARAEAVLFVGVGRVRSCVLGFVGALGGWVVWSLFLVGGGVFFGVGGDRGRGVLR